MNNVIYRKATEEDAYDIEYVAAHSWKETYTGIMPNEYLDNRILNIANSVEKTKNFLRTVDNFWVAEVDDKIVGILCFTKTADDKYKDYGRLDAIYVLKDYQGLGIGKRLFSIALKGLADLGYKNMYLECAVGNPTFNFYKKYNGIIVDTIDYPIKWFTVRADVLVFKNINEIYQYIAKETDVTETVYR